MSANSGRYSLDSFHAGHSISFRQICSVMSYKARVPEELFEAGHYLGRPADFDDRIVHRRLRLVEAVQGFTGKDKDLLEVGCGAGATMFLLSDKMNSCHGIDITNEHQREFESYKKEHGIENCDFEVLDIVGAKPEKQYDRIICFEVIEHLSDENGVQYLFDALKDDGILVVTVPNKWWIFETHGARLTLLPWNRVPFFSWLPQSIHERFANARIYTKNRIHKLLEKHGFEIEQSDYIMAPMDVLPASKIKSWLINNIFKKDTTNIPFKSTAIFVVAKKK